MDVRTERRDDALHVYPDGEMTIYTAAEFKPQLLQVLEQNDRVAVDLSRISEIDTSGVQLLMLAKREATAAGKDLTLLGHSPAVLEVFELLGLGHWFGDPQILPADAANRRAAA